jgi:hypothetical protein
MQDGRRPAVPFVMEEEQSAWSSSGPLGIGRKNRTGGHRELSDNGLVELPPPSSPST